MPEIALVMIIVSLTFFMAFHFIDGPGVWTTPHVGLIVLLIMWYIVYCITPWSYVGEQRIKPNEIGGIQILTIVGNDQAPVLYNLTQGYGRIFDKDETFIVTERDYRCYYGIRPEISSINPVARFEIKLEKKGEKDECVSK